MTVKELRDALATMPDDLPVRTEGCDCDGNAASVFVDNGRAYISRQTKEWWDKYYEEQKEYDLDQEKLAAEQRDRGLIA
jgi:hypothetical protein